MSALPHQERSAPDRPATDLRWLDPAAPPYAGVCELVMEMARIQAAVGWLSVPSRAEVMAWLDGVLAGGGRMVAVTSAAGQLVGKRG